jgi:hypothetical protein
LAYENHPYLAWGPRSGGSDNYTLWRQIDENNYEPIENTNRLFFIDEEFDISEYEDSYMVRYYVEESSNNTNEVTYSYILPKRNSMSDIKLSNILNQNFPNPFNPTTSIPFSIDRDGRVSLKIFNILGEEVRTLLDQELKAGNHVIKFDAGDLTSGTYLYRTSTTTYSETKKFQLLK